MPLSVSWIEPLGESRSIKLSLDSASQEFAFILCGNFYEFAEDEGNVDATFGPDDDLEVLKYLHTFLPQFRDLPGADNFSIMCCLSDVQIDQLSSSTAEARWKVIATYSVPGGSGGGGGGGSIGTTILGPEDGPADGEVYSEEFTQVSVNISGSMVNRKTSLNLIAKAVNTAKAADTVNWSVDRPAPIGVTSDGIEGAEVPDVTFTFQITVYKKPSSITYAYLRKLAALYGMLNETSFFDFPKGSVRFAGISFSGHIYQNIPVTFEFEQKNPFIFKNTGSNIPAPSEATGADYYDTIYDPDFASQPSTANFNAGVRYSGFDVVEYLYADEVNGTAGTIIQTPLHRLIHQVAWYANFSDLQI